MRSKEWLEKKGISDRDFIEIGTTDVIAGIMNDYKKDVVKEALQSLLDLGCHSEYLPEKIREAISEIDNPCGI